MQKSTCNHKRTSLWFFTYSSIYNLYHAFTNIRVKKVFQIFDHVSIYLLIAGTYTLYCLVSLGSAFGWTMFGIIWGLAILGTTIYSVFGNRMRKISSMTYILMGWLVLIAFVPLRNVLPKFSLSLLIGGGEKNG